MNVVDSCGWLEFIHGGERGALFAPAIRDVGELIVPTITILEVVKVLSRYASREHTMRAVSIMRQGMVVDLDETLAMDAAMLGVRLQMPTADSIVLATAQRHQARVWTQDADFAGKPGVKYFPKP